MHPRSKGWWKALLVCALLCGLAVAVVTSWDRTIGNRRMSFYGRVVDTDGNAVSGALVILTIEKVKWTSIPLVPYGTKTTKATKTVLTDSDGTFQLPSERGRYITVEDIVKLGYRRGFVVPKGRSRTASYFGVSTNRPDITERRISFILSQGTISPATSSSVSGQDK